MSNAASPAEGKAGLSIVLGGPLYQFYLRFRLARPPLELLRRRIVAVVLISWLPLAVLAIIEGRAIGGAAVPLFQHLSPHVRFLPCVAALDPRGSDRTSANPHEKSRI